MSYRGDIAIDDTNVIAGTCHGMFLFPWYLLWLIGEATEALES